MRRRGLLAAGLALLSGCGSLPFAGGSDAEPRARPSGTEPSAEGTPPATETATVGGPPTAASRTETPDASEASRRVRGADTTTPLSPEESVFAGEPCPDHLQCFHAASPDVPVIVRPHREVLGIGERFTLTVENRSGVPAGFGPYHWDVKRYRDGTWTSVDQRDAVFGYRQELPPGESRVLTGLLTRRADGGGQGLAAAVAARPGEYRFELDVFSGELERWAVRFRVRPGFGSP